MVCFVFDSESKDNIQVSCAFIINVLIFCFAVDVTAAGEGQLEIMVNRGSVPNTVKMSRKGVFLVSFVPRDARTHIIDIKFNGDLLPRKLPKPTVFRLIAEFVRPENR